MKNPNHPKIGSNIKIEPIRDLVVIQRIKRHLTDHPRNFCLFTVGINTAFRASDLLRIQISQARHLKPGDSIELKEKKTGKHRRVTFNAACVNAINGYLQHRNDANEGELLFTGQRGVLTVQYINRLVKRWCNEARAAKGNYGSHTLRKTWGYHQRVTFGSDVPQLMEAFGHSSQKQTLAYLGIQADEIEALYLNEL